MKREIFNTSPRLKIPLAILLILISLSSSAQFNNVFNQTGPPGYKNQQEQTKEQKQNEDSVFTSVPSFTIKQYFSALLGKDTMKIGHMWIGSIILPGTAQIYNREYWKLPIIYGSIGAFAYGGYHNNMNFLRSGDLKFKSRRDLFYGGAFLAYWGSVMDGVISFKSDNKHLPGRASLFTAMVPGLGQAYNGDYWKIPIFYGGYIVTGYLIYSNNNEYLKYKNLYNQATTPGSEYSGNLSAPTLKYYRDTYRRLRDYSILSGALVYILNIVDANVFAYMKDFDVSDDLSMKMSPTFVDPIYPLLTKNESPRALGLKFQFTF